MKTKQEQICVEIEELEGRIAPSSFSYSYHGYSATGTITTSGGIVTVSGTVAGPAGTLSGTISFPAACS
jgi:hypothetical protein